MGCQVFVAAGVQEFVKGTHVHVVFLYIPVLVEFLNEVFVVPAHEVEVLVEEVVGISGHD